MIEYDVEIDSALTERWYKKGTDILHRLNGPAVKFTDGYEAWYFEGKWHRDGGPAIEWADGSKEWYQNDLYHREDGPAVEGFDGRKEYWYQGQRIHCSSDEEYKRLLKLKVFW